MYETMSDHALPEELIPFRDNVRRFVDRELRPFEQQVAREGRLPAEALATITAKAKAAGKYAKKQPPPITAVRVS